MKEVTDRHKVCCISRSICHLMQKKTKEFGLQVGQAIQYEWFRKDGMSHVDFIISG